MPDSPPRYGTMPEPNRFFLSPWLRFPAIFSKPPFSPLYSRRSPAAPPPSDRFRPFFRFTGNRVSPCDLSVRLSAPYGISIAPKRKGDNGVRRIFAFRSDKPTKKESPKALGCPGGLHGPGIRAANIPWRRNLGWILPQKAKGQACCGGWDPSADRLGCW